METISMHIKNKNKLSATYGRVFFFVVLSERLMKGTQKFIFSQLFVVRKLCFHTTFENFKKIQRERKTRQKATHTAEQEKSKSGVG